MAPSAPPPSADGRLGYAEAAALLELAEGAIRDGLAGRPFAAPDLSTLPPALQEPGGVFVTLRVGGELNGCIGTVEGVEPRAHAVARCARSAAFGDPRLPALRAAELPFLAVEVSVLSPLEPVAATSRQGLAVLLRPGVDGLVLASGHRRGVFLPAVWEQLPDPEDFLDHLVAKAGIRPATWPADMRAYRFTAEKLRSAPSSSAAPAAAP